MEVFKSSRLNIFLKGFANSSSPQVLFPNRDKTLSSKAVMPSFLYSNKETPLLSFFSGLVYLGKYFFVLRYANLKILLVWLFTFSDYLFTVPIS